MAYQQIWHDALQPGIIITVHGSLREQSDGCNLALLHAHAPQQRAQQDCNQNHAVPRVCQRRILNISKGC